MQDIKDLYLEETINHMTIRVIEPKLIDTQNKSLNWLIWGNWLSYHTISN